MYAYKTDYTAMQRTDAVIADYFAAPGAKSWTELASKLLPEPQFGASESELAQYQAWIKYTAMVARGRLEKRLGRRHPDLELAWNAIDDRTIRLNWPITLASRSLSDSTRAAERQQQEAAQIAARAANAPNADVSKRFPITGARPYHSGSIEAINLPDDPIPYAWRDRAMRLVGQLFSMTREKRRQGILKQSGMTVIKTLMLNFANQKTGACYPSYEAIAARTGLGRTTVAEAIALLGDLGFLQVTNRVKRVPILGKGGAVIGSRPVQTSNTYKLGTGNWLAIAAAAPKSSLDAVAEWLQQWSKFLKELKAFLLKMTEYETRSVTDTNILLERKNYPKPSSHTPYLKRLCRWRPAFVPTVALNSRN